MSRVGDKLTITVVAVPESGVRDTDEVCDECVFNAQVSCENMPCIPERGGESIIYVPESEADKYIVRAMERRME